MLSNANRRATEVGSSAIRLSGNQILGVCGGFAINAFAYLCAFGFVYRLSPSQRHELIGDNEEPSRSAGRTL